MRAVWSFWSRPMHACGRGCGWPSQQAHLLSWVLSVRTSTPHFSETMLVTDSEGAELLVAQLGLRFDTVSTMLDDLAGHDPDLWVLGKLSAYRAQDRPFLHIDSDVYLWRALPAALEAADVVATYPEYRRYGTADYRCPSLKADVRRVGGWLPPELDRYVPTGGLMRAENCGVIGGTRLDFLRHYADQSLRLIEHPRNQLAWQRRRPMVVDSLIIEQHMLSACLDAQRDMPSPRFPGVVIRYLFSDERAASEQAAERGFTHLIADAKHHPKVLQRLAARVGSDYPADYARCREIAGTGEGEAA